MTRYRSTLVVVVGLVGLGLAGACSSEPARDDAGGVAADDSGTGGDAREAAPSGAEAGGDATSDAFGDRPSSCAFVAPCDPIADTGCPPDQFCAASVTTSAGEGSARCYPRSGPVVKSRQDRCGPTMACPAHYVCVPVLGLCYHACDAANGGKVGRSPRFKLDHPACGQPNPATMSTDGPACQIPPATTCFGYCVSVLST